MKNKGTLILIFGGVLIFLYILLKSFHVISFYTIPTSAMEPNYPVNAFVTTTNLLSPDYNDVVAFKGKTLEVRGRRQSEEAVFLGRVVGKGPDVLELKDGLVYINGVKKEDGKSLKFGYQIDAQFRETNGYLIQQLPAEDKMGSAEHMVIYLDALQKDQFVGKENLPKVNYQVINSPQIISPIGHLIQEDWTINNYGPINIPENHFFILGDNRHKSEDSRWRGFVPKENIIGVAVGK